MVYLKVQKLTLDIGKLAEQAANINSTKVNRRQRFRLKIWAKAQLAAAKRTW